MKTVPVPVLHILLSITLFLIFHQYTFADSEVDLTDKYIKQMNIVDGTGAMLEMHEFYDNVPDNVKANVLSGVLDRASRRHCEVVIRNILVMLDSDEFGPPIKWTDHLKRSIWSLTNSPDWNTRSLLVDLLKDRQKEDARSIMLILQNDSDDRVQLDALNAISKWPDALSIYQAYIQAHQGDPAFAKAVHNAQTHINLLLDAQASPSQ